MVAGHGPGRGRGAPAADLAAVPGGDEGDPGRPAARDGQAAALAVLLPRGHLAAAVGSIAGRGPPGQFLGPAAAPVAAGQRAESPLRRQRPVVRSADAHLRRRDPAGTGVDADQDPQVPGHRHGRDPRPRRIRQAPRTGRGRAGILHGRRPLRGHQGRDADGLQRRPRQRHHRRGLRGTSRHPAAGPRPRRPEESRLLPAAASPRHLPRRRPGHDPRVRPGPGTADRRGTRRPLPAAVQAGPRPARGLPEGTAARAGLRQPGLGLTVPGRPVLGQDRGPVPGHHHTRAAAGGHPRLEGRPADHQARRHWPGWAADRRHPPADQRQGRAHTRPGALPRHLPVGHGGTRPLGAVGSPEPGQRRQDQLGQGTPEAQGPDGPADPRAAARPARPRPHRRRPQDRDLPPPPGRHHDAARRDHRGHRRDTAPGRRAQGQRAARAGRGHRCRQAPQPVI